MNLIAPLSSLTLSLAIVAGVLFHDTHLDRAVTSAIALPALIAGYGVAEVLKSNDHTHVERGSVGNRSNPTHSPMPRLQPRDDDKRYVQNKKMYFGSDNGYVWPSV